MPDWSFLPVPAVYSQCQAAQTAAKPNSSTSELLQFECMENFSRIRTIERVGKWSKAKSVVDVKNTAGLVQTPNVHYVPYVPNDQTNPVFQWFCNLPGEPIVDEETLYQLLTLDDDDNHELPRSIVGCWQEDAGSIPRGRLQWNKHETSVDRAPRSSGSHTKLRWSMHQASSVWVGLRGWCAQASDFLGKSWGILEPAAKSWGSSAGNSGKIWEFCIIRRHRSRVLQSRPEKRRDLSHVTQPRARINVSCSRAGHKWLGDPHEEEWGGYRTRAGQGRLIAYFLWPRLS